MLKRFKIIQLVAFMKEILLMEKEVKRQLKWTKIIIYNINSSVFIFYNQFNRENESGLWKGQLK